MMISLCALEQARWRAVLEWNGDNKEITFDSWDQYKMKASVNTSFLSSSL